LPPAVMTPGASPLASAPRGMTANLRRAVRVASPLVRLHATARGVNPLANPPVMERPANLLPKARAMANALHPVANPASSPVRPRARGVRIRALRVNLPVTPNRPVISRNSKPVATAGRALASPLANLAQRQDRSRGGNRGLQKPIAPPARERDQRERVRGAGNTRRP